MSIMYLVNNAEIALKKVHKEKKLEICADPGHMFHIDSMPEAALDFKDTCADFCKEVIN